MSEPIRIAGVAPRDVVVPRTVDELAQTVRALHAARRAFAFVGGGTQLELGNPPTALDTVVRTSALDRVIEYAPEDQTITVEAGMTFEELDRVLAANAQMLPLDVADRTRSTIGGAVATNAYGARRQRYGTVKDLIVGVQIVRPDGTLARGGGKVVKNVAGFDLPKLVVGSLGTLGAIVSLTLRVYPLPEATIALRVQGHRYRLGAESGVDPLTAGIVASRLEPTSIAVYGRRDGDRSANTGTVVRFAGVPAGVRAQRDRLAALAGELGATVDELDDAALHAYDDVEREVRTTGTWRARVSAPPARIATATGGLTGAAAWRDADVRVVYPGLGAALVASSAAAQPRALADARTSERADGVTTVFHAMPEAWRADLDAWGPPPPSLPVMRALKDRFDPYGLCNPGRFVGGI